MPDTPLIQQIRTASRLMVRELGFMSTTLAATHYSPSAVHTLLEVSMRGEMTAAQLVTLLGLEKSSVSRMVSRLLAAGELEERPCAEDARAKSLALTAKGHDTVAKINAWGTRQVVKALDHLDETQQQTVATGLAAYARALAQCRDSALADTAPQISLMTGYQPGMIGRIAQMHGEYYARHHDFGAFLKARSPAA
ncbi:MarR family winged helix-turn-helix transcriptional regulator [Klebsiella pneumoniae]|nr:MarR family winged helix-turn-helix transcriptional regulator [Klebsiella pneumoniae]WET95213.1 MarR family winged helix-turn-helix transcriptional regulator [Klebsiella pneumoniae]WME29562.1 MarR family winged helix-turn-helix transcriptional regulator [Klebsiella pneumoniae]